MPILPIKIYGSEVLREKAEAIPELTGEVRQLVGWMKESMYYHQGVGLAANQVGIAKRLFVADDGNGFRAFINAAIVETDARAEAEEGCLSLPGIYVDIGRASRITVEYLDQDGEQRRLDAEGLLARIIQHELDHLDGVLISDRAGFLARKMMAGKLKKLARRAREIL